MQGLAAKACWQQHWHPPWDHLFFFSTHLQTLLHTLLHSPAIEGGLNGARRVRWAAAGMQHPASHAVTWPHCASSLPQPFSPFCICMPGLKVRLVTWMSVTLGLPPSRLASLVRRSVLAARHRDWASLSALPEVWLV